MQDAIDHCLHVMQFTSDLVTRNRVTNEFAVQTQTGDRRAEVRELTAASICVRSSISVLIRLRI